MKTIRFLVFMLLSTLILGSCSNDDDQVVDTSSDRVAVQFGTGNIAQTKTTAGGNQWVAGDRIGIFMINEGEGLSAAEIAEGADNVQYQAVTGNSNQSGFTPVNPSETIYYPHNGDKVDFIAYYPYKAPLTDYKYPIDISDQTNPAALDVLYGKAEAKDKNSGTINLDFKHKLCRIVLNLSSRGSMIEDPEFNNMLSSDVSFLGFPVEATINLEDGTVLPSSDRSQTFSPIKTSSPPADYMAQFTAIVVPDIATTGRKITFHFTNLSKKWIYSISPVKSFDSGTQYTFNLSFMPRTRSFSTESFDSEITELHVTEIKQEVWR